MTILYEIEKLTLGEFHKFYTIFHMKWPRVVDSDPLNWYLFAFKMSITSTGQRIVDTDVANDVSDTHQFYFTCGHTMFMT